MPQSTVRQALNRANTAPTLLAGLMLLTLLMLVLRDAAYYPRTFLDEWVYSQASRSRDFARETIPHAHFIPNYLYYFIFRATNYCGDGYLVCARTLNAAFFVSALPFIYLVARRVAEPRACAVVTVLTALGPLNSYTAFFMPEATYFLGFWVLTWFVLTFRELAPWRFGGIAGSLLGAGALIKFHAVFLIPAVVALMAFIAWRRAGAGRLRAATVMIGSLAIAFCVLRFGLGYLLAGRDGMSLAEGSYATFATTVSTREGIPLLDWSTLVSLRLNFLTLVVVLGVPCAALLRLPARSQAADAAANEFAFLQVYALVLFVCLVGVTGKFSASLAAVYATTVSGNDIHERYYNFAYPLLFIVGAAQASLASTVSGRALSWLPALVVAAIVATGAATLKGDGIATMAVFAPVIGGYMAKTSVFLALCTFGVVTVLVWGRDRRSGGWLFTFVYLPLSVAYAAYFTNLEARLYNRLTVNDSAGLFARQNLGPNDRAHLLVIGPPDDAVGYRAARALMHVDQAGANFRVARESAPLALSALPENVDWVLTIGEREIAEKNVFSVAMNGYSLFKVPGRTRVDFTRPYWPGLITRSTGFGDWQPPWALVTGKTASLEFAAPLPAAFDLFITGSARGRAANSPLYAVVGERREAFRLSGSTDTTSVTIDNPGRARTIAIELPDAQPGAGVAGGGGTAPAAIRLVEMRVVSRRE